MSRLRKIRVMPGVSWVEAPEVGLYLLCGCPADVVKHLMRRGLIADTESKGVSFETGPNAILLSDVMLQNGVFCNLAEFPVLQMLYRQGMLLPGHPNNKGERPILIGSREQVEAQMNYIHRGNYGLVSIEEMLDAGATQEVAEELMAMKLNFAFGRISHPRELLDAVTLDDDPVEIKAGVTLRRIARNRFEIRLGEEIVAVDLNLKPEETYPPPYLLGSHRFERQYFAVIHTGEGDGWDPNRPAMGSILVYQGRIYLIDAGPNLQCILTAMGIGINEVEGLFHTHCHDDHFGGLTTLLTADHRIKYYATPMVRASVAKKLSAMMSEDERMFADFFDHRDLEPDQWNQIDGMDVKPITSPHPVETTVMIFRAPWEGGYRTYAHFADIVSLDLLKSMIGTAKKAGISREFYDKVVENYATPVDVKKLDIGGGMIHGLAEDFAKDLSGKIVLAHIARPFTVAEKEIGSGAPFGTVDVIINGNHDFVWRSAYEALRNYFPKTPHYEMRVLLNNPIIVCNPETILLREGHAPTHIHLLLTGTVEVMEAGSPLNGLLSAGAMVGEMAGIEGRASRKTFRAQSFVQALKMSAPLYREFVRRNGLTQEITALEGRRNFLRSTWLGSEALSESTLNRLAKTLTPIDYAAGHQIALGGSLALLKSGTIEIMYGDDVVESLGPGDFFGEETAIFDTTTPFTFRIAKPSEIYLLDPALVRHVPVLRWKLLERYKLRMQSSVGVISPGDESHLRWLDEFAVNVPLIDHQHRNLIARTNRVLTAILRGDDESEAREAFGDLIDYTRFHFLEEEKLLEMHGGDGKAHRAKHGRLVQRVVEIREQFQAGPRPANAVMAETLRDWLVGHILAGNDLLAMDVSSRDAG
jgi:hemerythrin